MDRFYPLSRGWTEDSQDFDLELVASPRLRGLYAAE